MSSEECLYQKWWMKAASFSFLDPHSLTKTKKTPVEYLQHFRKTTSWSFALLSLSGTTLNVPRYVPTVPYSTILRCPTWPTGSAASQTGAGASTGHCRTYIPAGASCGLPAPCGLRGIHSWAFGSVMDLSSSGTYLAIACAWTSALEGIFAAQAVFYVLSSCEQRRNLSLLPNKSPRPILELW